MLAKATLEKYQVFIYLSFIACGLLLGSLLPSHVGFLELMLWPLLGLLMYTKFTQVPLTHLRTAFTDTRFITAAVVGNFIVLPLVVWGLMHLGPSHPAAQLGILLVLLLPCTDWFITFTHLGGGDTRHAIAFTPISLLLQLLLLPVYLWLFMGAEVTIGLLQKELIAAFLGLIVLPLLAAFITEKWVDQNKSRQQLLGFFAWFPVPLLALVVFSIAAAHVSLVFESVGMLAHLLLIFTVFLVIAGLLSRVLTRAFRLPKKQGRVLAFSLGSRNSFVVLPLALTLHASMELAVVVIIFQSLVELIGLAAYVWWVPQKLHQ